MRLGECQSLLVGFFTLSTAELLSSGNSGLSSDSNADSSFKKSLSLSDSFSDVSLSGSSSPDIPDTIFVKDALTITLLYVIVNDTTLSCVFFCARISPLSKSNTENDFT